MPDALDSLTPTSQQDALDSLAPTKPIGQRIIAGAKEGLGISLPTHIGTPSEWGHDFVNSLTGVWDTMKDQNAKMREAWNRGDIPTAVMHGIGNAFPPLAPTANAQDKVVSGDVAGGLTQGIVNSVPQMLGLRPAAKAAGVIEKPSLPEEAPLTPPPPTAEEASAQAGIKKLQELRAAKPAVVDSSARTALPMLKRYEPWTGPVDITQNVDQAQQLAEDHLNDKFDTYYNAAKTRGYTGNGNTVAENKLSSPYAQGLKQKIDAITASGGTPDPSDVTAYNNVVAEANSFRRQMPLDEIRDRLQILNQQLNPYHKASDDGKYQMEMGNPKISDRLAEAQGLRQTLYQAIDPENDGVNAANIRNRMADLINFRQFTQNVKDKIAQTTPPSGMNRALNGALGIGEAGYGIARMAHGESSGVFAANYGANRIVSALKSSDPAVAKFNAVFKNWNGPALDHIPDADEPQVIPPERQLAPPTIKLPAQDTTSVKITTGKPLDQFTPIELVSQLPTNPSPTFQWQRLLTPESNIDWTPQP